jgi:hypothetical protein
MDLLHREQTPTFVRLRHDLTIAPQYDRPANCELPIPALRLGRERSYRKAIDFA